ncbi:MAG: S10 family serine carboxypeptidase-like protein, partial [Alphaproteobacteria bacterium]
MPASNDTSAGTFAGDPKAPPHSEQTGAGGGTAAIKPARKPAVTVAAAGQTIARTEAQRGAEARAQIERLQAQKIAATKKAAAARARAEAAKLARAGRIQQASDVLKAEGLDEEAYALFGPEDYAFHAEDHPAPDTVNVSEQPSIMRHTMTLKGKTVRYTARAGHLVAYGQKDANGKKDAKAALFYVSYTRDDLPHEDRPVTFFINGGPNYSSIFLHMAAWAPKRVRMDVPNLPLYKKDFDFPLIDNDETLLDQSDLVFVDAVGTGYSKAIKPHADDEFRSVQSDAEIFRDFVTSYSNRNNRQSSPKYIYGESYGGSRVSYAASLLENAGTSNFDPDSSGKPAKVLTGVILGSPALFGNACPQFGLYACNVDFPSKAMVADYFQPADTSWRGKRSLEDYADYLRQVYINDYAPALKVLFSSLGRPSPAVEAQVQPVLDALRKIFASSTLSWADMMAQVVLQNLPAAQYYGAFDGRMVAEDYSPDDFDDTVLGDAVKAHLPQFVNYFAKPDDYVVYCPCGWDYARQPGGVAELSDALTIDPKLKVLAIHGYYDLRTPFFDTEIQLKQAGLDKLVPVKLFDGGHMTYYSEAARAPMKKALDAFYA